MNKNRNSGGTLGFVAAVTLTVILIGAAFFFFARMLGGARELQHVTDAGSLNVAKQSLVTPTVNIFGQPPYDLGGDRLQQVQRNFRAHVDPANGQISLRMFNRVVAQAMTVAINASVDNYSLGPPNPRGIENARRLIDLVANPDNGIGTILANKLRSDQIMDNHFSNLVMRAPMRMLNPGGPAAAVVGGQKEVSYMVRGLATNMRISLDAIPQDYRSFIDPGFADNNMIVKNGDRYLRGYQFINIPGITDNALWPLMGVPLRPGERPHLVALSSFRDSQQSPLPAPGPQGSRVPPNAFKAHGNSAEFKSVQTLEALACAIAGSINMPGIPPGVPPDLPPLIPGGYIVVANGRGFTPSQYPGEVTVDRDAAGLTGRRFSGDANDDIFVRLLMHPATEQGGGGVGTTPNGAMSRDLNKLWRIGQWRARNPEGPVPPELVTFVDGETWAEKQADADGIPAYVEPKLCTHLNTPPGVPGGIPQCQRLLAKMARVYGFFIPDPNQGSTYKGLMAIEKLKNDIISPRSYGGPAIVSPEIAAGKCTGLKSFNFAGISSQDPVDFGRPPTVANLLQSFIGFGPTSRDAITIRQQLLERIRQMKQNATEGEIASALGSLPMGTVKYIWRDDHGNLRFTDASGLPPRINPGQVLPDGSLMLAVADFGKVEGPNALNSRFINLDNEQNYPKPWDCPPPDTNKGFARAGLIWIKSSGYNGCLGVLKFEQCTKASGGWNCPC